MMREADIVVIGAGIAGVSVAAHLAETRKTIIVEMEERAAFHTTGRSAAVFEPNYGPPAMLAFTRASDAFFKDPPKGFTTAPIFTPREALFFVPKGQEKQAETLWATSTGLVELTEAEAQRRFPIMRKGFSKRTFLDPHTGDLDVDLLHQGYLRQVRERGGEILLSSPVKDLSFENGKWRIIAGSETLLAPIVINAAGAWGDVLARMAGAEPVGLTPKRRSIAVVPLEGQSKFSNWPLVTDVGETWYAKPQSGKLIVSSCDATPCEPHDAFADDMAIAQGIDRLEKATTLKVGRLDHAWGGLRTFAGDGNPVIGFDPGVDGFFWLVGQGGYGIQTSPALSEAASLLVKGLSIPQRTIDFGLKTAQISPARFPLAS